MMEGYGKDVLLVFLTTSLTLSTQCIQPNLQQIIELELFGFSNDTYGYSVKTSAVGAKWLLNKNLFQ